MLNLLEMKLSNVLFGILLELALDAYFFGLTYYKI